MGQTFLIKLILKKMIIFSNIRIQAKNSKIDIKEKIPHYDFGLPEFDGMDFDRIHGFCQKFSIVRKIHSHYRKSTSILLCNENLSNKQKIN